MRRLASLTLVLGYSSVALLATTACNGLLGTPDEDLRRDASVSDGAGDQAVLADAHDDQSITPDSAADSLGDRVAMADTAADVPDSGADVTDSGPDVPDSGPDVPDSADVIDSGTDVPGDAGPDSDAASIVCADSCPDGGCVLPTCPVRVAGELGRTVSVFADPGDAGSVFFGDFDGRTVNHYDKATGAVGRYAASSGNVVAIVANATNVFWSLWNHGIGWAERSTGTTGEVHDTSYGVTWATPWSMGIDDGFIYWNDRSAPDCWRMDLGLKTPRSLYTELLPDGAPSPEQPTGNIAVDPGGGDTGFVFFTVGNEIRRMDKNGTNVVAYAPVLGYPTIGIHGGYLYWVDAAGTMRRAPEDVAPSCDAAGCGEVVVPAGTPEVAGPSAFDDTYAYWHFDEPSNQSVIARARLNGTSTHIEVLVRHTAISSVGVDDVAIYYTTQNDDGVDNTGSFWRLAK